MSSAKHTPGPWKLERLKTSSLFGSESYTVGVWTGDNQRIALMGSDQEANAALITAAPELLEAVRFALSRLPRSEYGGVIYQLEMALAKAEGR